MSSVLLKFSDVDKCIGEVRMSKKALEDIKARVRELPAVDIFEQEDEIKKLKNLVDDKDGSISELRNEILELSKKYKNIIEEKNNEIMLLMNEIKSLKEITEGEDVDTSIDGRIDRVEDVSKRDLVRNALSKVEPRLIRIDNKMYCNYDIILMKGKLDIRFNGKLNKDETSVRGRIKLILDPDAQKRRAEIAKRCYEKGKMKNKNKNKGEE